MNTPLDGVLDGDGCHKVGGKSQQRIPVGHPFMGCHKPLWGATSAGTQIAHSPRHGSTHPARWHFLHRSQRVLRHIVHAGSSQCVHAQRVLPGMSIGASCDVPALRLHGFCVLLHARSRSLVAMREPRRCIAARLRRDVEAANRIRMVQASWRKTLAEGVLRACITQR